MVFVIGAGSTYNEGKEGGVEESKRPPLDKKFFNRYKPGFDNNADLIEKYLKDTYGISFYKDEYNSLDLAIGMFSHYEPKLTP